jgi:GxxExxY protein
MDKVERTIYEVLQAALEVHKVLGPGLLESVYEEALCKELEIRNIGFERQKGIIVDYKGFAIKGQRVDLLVNRCLVVEIKATKEIEEVFIAQVLTYLKILDLNLGLILNFNKALLKEGIKRVILTTNKNTKKKT